MRARWVEPIRPRREKRAVLLACILMFVPALVALMTSAKADASPLSYLQSLNNRGLVVNDTAAAIRAGWMICNELNVADGNVVAARVYNSFYDVHTLGQAQTMVITAVEELCSWHDHRGFVA